MFSWRASWPMWQRCRNDCSSRLEACDVAIVDHDRLHEISRLENASNHLLVSADVHPSHFPDPHLKTNVKKRARASEPQIEAQAIRDTTSSAIARWSDFSQSLIAFACPSSEAMSSNGRWARAVIYYSQNPLTHMMLKQQPSQEYSPIRIISITGMKILEVRIRFVRK